MKILTRAEWGARPFRTDPPHVPLSARKWFICHYPGAGTPPRDVRGYARWIERIHMDGNGWRGVGYNYLIDADGNIAEGCGRDVRGSHSPEHNVDGIGVNIWTSNGQSTPEAMHAARWLYDELNREKGGTPLRIGWHGMDYPTECPGPQLREWARRGMPDPLASIHVSKPPPAVPAAPKGLMGMGKIITYKRRAHKARVGKWSTVTLNSKGYITLYVGPGNCLAQVQVQADIPKGATVQGRFYEVDFKAGQTTKRISTHPVCLELGSTGGQSFGTATDLTYIGDGRDGRSRRLRFEMVAWDTKADIKAQVNFAVMGE